MFNLKIEQDLKKEEAAGWEHAATGTNNIMKYGEGQMD